MARKSVTHNILIVENSPTDQILIAEAFKSCGHQCALNFAATLEQAMEHLRETPINLVILDLYLEWQDGLELVKMMRADAGLATIPIVAFSGRLDATFRAYEAGVNSFIAKSLDYAEFSHKIKSLMDFWVYVAELPDVSHSLPPTLMEFK